LYLYIYLFIVLNIIIILKILGCNSKKLFVL
jgi:hypothetical protein